MKATKPERTPQIADKYVLRMPDGMREQLSALAKANNRSMNAEIVLMLQQAIDARSSGIHTLDLDVLAESLATKLAIKLRLPTND